MFTQPCYIKKNNSYLRNTLKELGYKCNNGKWMGSYLATFKRDNDHDLFYCGTPKYDLVNNPSLKDSIDCGENEDLFLAIAALRDDSDMHQWFVNPKIKSIKMPGYYPQIVGMDGYKQIVYGYEWIKSEYNDISEKIKNAIDNGEDPNFLPHKATVKELIEHFKC